MKNDDIQPFKWNVRKSHTDLEVDKLEVLADANYYEAEEIKNALTTV